MELSQGYSLREVNQLERHNLTLDGRFKAREKTIEIEIRGKLEMRLASVSNLER